MGDEVARLTVDVLHSGVLHFPLLEAAIQGEDFGNMPAYSKGLKLSSWGLGVIGQGLAGWHLYLKYKNVQNTTSMRDKLDEASQVAGIVGGLLSTVATGLEIGGVESDEDLAKSICDTAKEGALLGSGVVGLWAAAEPNKVSAILGLNGAAIAASVPGIVLTAMKV